MSFSRANITWDNATKSVRAVKDTTTIALRVNDLVAYVPQLINGNTMVPLRFVSEALGAHVEWDPNTKTAIITSQLVSSEQIYQNNGQYPGFTCKGVGIGDLRSTVVSKLGNGKSSKYGDYPEEFGIIDSDGCTFGLKDDKVVQIYISSSSSFDNRIKGSGYSLKTIVNAIGADNLTYNSNFFTGDSLLIGHLGKMTLYISLWKDVEDLKTATDFGYVGLGIIDEDLITALKETDKKLFMDSGRKFNYKYQPYKNNVDN
ncbi:copper amine oxidase N-terminal domain-containing protein [Paenibacillus sp. N3.4]|uniref:copper amine oxidase N-terminal domain-containing protein n=1 Tax=Paenibacillus sp. N3.4 TaxID=2603222 RepID=UPI0037C7C56F